jgi:hypothetical protein
VVDGLARLRQRRPAGHLRVERLPLRQPRRRRLNDERNHLFWNLGDGKFVDVGYLTGSNRIEDGRGVAVADFDRDGRLDLLLQNLEKPAVLLMGRGETGAWLQVQLEGTQSNRDAIGAVVTVESEGRKQIRQVAAGSGFLSTSSRVLHFGLGDSERIDSIEVRWPSGYSDLRIDVAANQRLKIHESMPFGAPEPERQVLQQSGE